MKKLFLSISLLSLLVFIGCGGNSPPNTPGSPTGPSSGAVDESLSFSTHTTDPDNDDIAYLFDWGDENLSSWSSYTPSGNSVSQNHSYSSTGTFEIRVKAKDIQDKESGWSPGHIIDVDTTDGENAPTYDKGTNTLTVPNTTIYTEGNQYNGEATMPEDGLAVLMKKDSSLYFYTPLQGNISSLTPQTSIEALQLIFAERLNRSRSNRTRWQENTPVNITFSSLSGGNLEVVNNAFRCAAVQGKEASEPTILPSRTLFDVDLISLFQREWNDVLAFNKKSIDTLISPASDTFYLFGGITKTSLWGPALAPYLAAKFIPQSVEAFQINPSLYARVNLADALDIIIFPIRLVAGNSGADHFISQLALSTFYDVVYQMLSDITTSQSGDEVLRNVFNTVLIDIPVAMLSRHRNEIKDRNESRAVSFIIILKALSALSEATELYAGAYQSLTAESYTKWAIPSTINPPNTPNTPSGQSVGDVGTSYTFSTSTTDPDGDNVAYQFDWGDGNVSSWSSYVSSGSSVDMDHSWSSEGNYSVKAKAKDENGSESGWSSGHEIVIGNPASPWTTKASMPTGRGMLSAGVVNGKIYTIGGLYFSDFISENEEYNPTTDTWDTTKTDMPTARGSFAMGVVNGKIYAIGGEGNGNWTENEEYDPVTDTWKTKADMPTPRRDLAGIAANGKIYAMGGSDINFLSTNEEYDPSTNSWTAKADMPTARVAFSTGVVNGKIYAIGGSDGSKELNKNEEYDPTTDTWKTKADMPTPRKNLGIGVVNGKIYAIGGYNSEPLSTNEEYDPLTDSWETKTAMPSMRDRLSIGVVNGKIYAIGGSNGLPFNEEYDPSLDN